MKFLLTFPWLLYLISLKQWSFFSFPNLLNKVENDLLLCQDSTVPIHFSSLQFAFKMIYSGKYKQNFLLDCVLSDLPVANGSYLLSGNMPIENAECYKITLNYIFTEKCFSA